MAKTQWHPLFAKLLKALLDVHYRIDVEVAVSELPRRGDFLVVKRLPGRSPFAGVWGNLTDTNVIEFKGMSDAPDESDLDLFGHVALGLAHKHNEARHAQGQARLAPHELSLWFVAKELGETFLSAMRTRCLPRDYEGDGVWKARLMGHPLFFVSGRLLPNYELDSLPFKAMDAERPMSKQLSEMVAQDAGLLREYGETLMLHQPASWKEIVIMAQQAGLPVDWAAVGEVTDLTGAVRALPVKKVIEAIAPNDLIEAILQESWLRRLVEQMTPEQKAALLGQLQPRSEP